jgi:hypothetical protein
MLCFCIALGSFALGMFSAFFLYGWFEAQSDPYTGIPWAPDWEPSPYRFP